MTDGLVRLFTNPLLPVRVARDLGMLALDLVSAGETVADPSIHGHQRPLAATGPGTES